MVFGWLIWLWRMEKLSEGGTVRWRLCECLSSLLYLSSPIITNFLMKERKPSSIPTWICMHHQAQQRGWLVVFSWIVLHIGMLGKDCMHFFPRVTCLSFSSTWTMAGIFNNFMSTKPSRARYKSCNASSLCSIPYEELLLHSMVQSGTVWYFIVHMTSDFYTLHFTVSLSDTISNLSHKLWSHLLLHFSNYRIVSFFWLLCRTVDGI